MKDVEDISSMMAELGQRARAAAKVLSTAPAEAKTRALNAAADALWASRAEVIAENAKDLEFGRNKGLTDAMMDRLMLDDTRIQGICDGLRSVAGQDDPVGAVLAEWVHCIRYLVTAQNQIRAAHLLQLRPDLGVERFGSAIEG